MQRSTFASRRRWKATNGTPAKQVLSFEALQAQLHQHQQPPPSTQTTAKPQGNHPVCTQRRSGGSSRSTTIRAPSPLQRRIRQQILHGRDIPDGAASAAMPCDPPKRSDADCGEPKDCSRISSSSSKRVAPKPIITRQMSTRSLHLEMPPSPERPFPSSTPKKRMSSAQSLSPAPSTVAMNTNNKYCHGRGSSVSVQSTKNLPRTSPTTKTTKSFARSISVGNSEKTMSTVVQQSNSLAKKPNGSSSFTTSNNTSQRAAQTTTAPTKAASSLPKQPPLATTTSPHHQRSATTSKASRLLVASSSFQSQSITNSTKNGASCITISITNTSRTASSAATQQPSPSLAGPTNDCNVAPTKPLSLQRFSATVETVGALRRERYMAATNKSQLATPGTTFRSAVTIQRSPAATQKHRADKDVASGFSTVAASSSPQNNRSANNNNKSHPASSTRANIGFSRTQFLQGSGSRVPSPKLTTQSSTSASSSKKLTKADTQSSIRNLPTSHNSKSTPVLCVKTFRSPLSPRNTGSSVPTSKRRSTTKQIETGSSGPSTRRNLDKKSARLKYGEDFASEIDRYMAGIHSMTSPLAVAMTPQSGGHPKKTSCLNVFVRKRPIFASHLESGDFDVVQIVNSCDDNDKGNKKSNAFAGASEVTPAVVVYKTSMAADMMTKMVQPVVFSECITSAFDDQTGSQTVYRTAVQPLVQNVQQRGKASTLLMFGQTGSGKTYTMSACLKLVAAELFASRAVKQVEVQCLELAGKRCRDLMQAGENATTSEVRIKDNKDGSVTFVGASKSLIDSPRQLVVVFEECQKRRATQSTEQNDVSSRSHAVFQLKLQDERGGVLRLFDCAGTERRHDSLMHSKERQMESREINESLYAFKECIRVRTNNGKTQQKVLVPYRSSNLTRILRESLESEDASLAVIGCIAPEATATEHTIQTLKTLCDLTGTEFHEGKAEKLSDVNGVEPAVPPQKWDYDGLVRWLSDQSLLGNSPVPGHLDGKLIMRMNRMQLRNALYDNETMTGGRPASELGMEKAAKLFDSLREESGRVARLELQRRMTNPFPS